MVASRFRGPTNRPGWRFFTAEEDALLGTAPDPVIPQRIGQHPASV